MKTEQLPIKDMTDRQTDKVQGDLIIQKHHL